MTGKFIVIEGMDNCGKTTQANMLKKYFQENHQKVILTREPGGTEVGEEIRRVLLKVRKGMIDPVVQALLFYASRKEFLKNIVGPALKNKLIVITDRFTPSTYVYQGYVQGVDKNFIDWLDEVIVNKSGFKPNLTIILDIPAEESLKRGQNQDMKNQKLIYEKQGLKFMKKLSSGYKKYAGANRSKVILLDGTKSKKEIFKQITKSVKKL